MSLRLKLKCRRVMPRVFFAGGRLGGDPAPDENEGPINSLSMSVVCTKYMGMGGEGNHRQPAIGPHIRGDVKILCGPLPNSRMTPSIDALALVI